MKAKMSTLSKNDENEVDLKDDEEGKIETTKSIKDTLALTIATESNSSIPDQHADKEEEPSKHTIKKDNNKESFQQRLLRLKMKMNESRTLNRKEVLNEAERLGTEEGVQKERKRTQIEEKRRRKKEWEDCHEKAISSASNEKEAKLLVQHASDSIRIASKKELKAKETRFDVDDYHNPEGQYRHYERNLRSLPKIDREYSSEMYDPLTHKEDDEHKAITQEGAKRLAAEMKRRAEKSIKKKIKLDKDDSGDISYINQRNKRFNEKIGRNFDKHTAEIKQNLERGTAL